MKASTREIGALRSNFLKLSLCGLLAGTLLVWAGPPGAQTAAAPQTGAGPRQNQLTVERIYSPIWAVALIRRRHRRPRGRPAAA